MRVSVSGVQMCVVRKATKQSGESFCIFCYSSHIQLYPAFAYLSATCAWIHFPFALSKPSLASNATNFPRFKAHWRLFKFNLHENFEVEMEEMKSVEFLFVYHNEYVYMCVRVCLHSRSILQIALWLRWHAHAARSQTENKTTNKNENAKLEWELFFRATSSSMYILL